jgi:predicted secreted protein
MPALTCPDASKYYLGNDALVLFGDTLLTPQAPTPANITLTTAAPAVAIGGPTVTLSTALTKPVYRGERLKFGSSVVQVDADANTGATTITVKPALSAIAAGATATKNALVVFEGAQNAKFDINSEFAEFRNLGACDWATFLATKKMASISFDGFPMADDLGYALIRQASMSRTSRLLVMVIEPDGRMFSAPCFVESLSSEASQDAPFKRSFGMKVSGQPTYGTATDLVLA